MKVSLHAQENQRVPSAGVSKRRRASRDQPPTLADLGLAQTAISDGDLPALQQFTKLSGINLQDTKMTEAGVEQLKKGAT